MRVYQTRWNVEYCYYLCMDLERRGVTVCDDKRGLFCVADRLTFCTWFKANATDAEEMETVMVRDAFAEHVPTASMKLNLLAFTVTAIVPTKSVFSVRLSHGQVRRSNAQSRCRRHFTVFLHNFYKPSTFDYSPHLRYLIQIPADEPPVASSTTSLRI